MNIRRAFSLIEIVIALGISSFVILSLLGIFSSGIQTSQESMEELQAAHTAQSILSQRRAAPTAEIRHFPLPPLNQIVPQKSIPQGIDSHGRLVNNLSQARYGFSYEIKPSSNALLKATLVSLRLHWPAAAQPENASGHYELSTWIHLP